MTKRPDALEVRLRDSVALGALVRKVERKGGGGGGDSGCRSVHLTATKQGQESQTGRIQMNRPIGGNKMIRNATFEALPPNLWCMINRAREIIG